MTQTENLEAPATRCHFCQGPATAVKLEATAPIEEDDVETIERLPICGSCNAYWYDGTEEYPKLQPLG